VNFDDYTTVATTMMRRHEPHKTKVGPTTLSKTYVGDSDRVQEGRGQLLDRGT